MTAFIAVLIAVCVAPLCHGADRFYADPSFKAVHHGDLARQDNPLRLKISVTETWAGKPVPIEDLQDRRRAAVTSILRESGLIQSSYAGEDGSLAIRVESLNIQTIASKGPGRINAWTYGLEASLERAGTTTTRQYQYKTMQYVGRAREPPELTQPMGYVEVQRFALEQMLLSALRDFQQAGVIPNPGAPTPAPVN